MATHVLDPYETVLCIATVSLEISEITHDRQDMVCIGTALLRGEDLPSTGCIYVFAVIDVVPEPDRPETGKALKLFAKEEVKGAVTSLSGVGTEGFLMVAMGQKVMVRGLKEDGTLLPVAFIDVQCYVSVVRELGPVTPGSSEGAGLCLIGDAVRGVWLTGYMVCKILTIILSDYIELMVSLNRKTLTSSASSANPHTKSKPSPPNSSQMANNSTSLSQTRTVISTSSSLNPKVCPFLVNRLSRIPAFSHTPPPFLKFKTRKIQKHLRLY